MKNTNKKMGVYWSKYDWRFERTIWKDEITDIHYIKVNGLLRNIEQIKSLCDYYYIVY